MLFDVGLGCWFKRQCIFAVRFPLGWSFGLDFRLGLQDFDTFAAGTSHPATHHSTGSQPDSQGLAVLHGFARRIEFLDHQLTGTLWNVEGHPIGLRLGQGLPTHEDALGEIRVVDIATSPPIASPHLGLPTVVIRHMHCHDSATHMGKEAATDILHIRRFHPHFHIVRRQEAQAPISVGQITSALVGLGAAA
ncbi:hypothetical protein A9C11_31290 [Pseudomonas citronellolis]|uniref:Uncharacterized protein n=1 Tax=Pseudomonas citronellolis TaxID=53408 RepID=A0A1A9KK50_9PSED|nr:hypothetical protein A9C11_31290 [Pseudomonas citronellolis]